MMVFVHDSSAQENKVENHESDASLGPSKTLSYNTKG